MGLKVRLNEATFYVYLYYVEFMKFGKVMKISPTMKNFDELLVIVSHGFLLKSLLDMNQYSDRIFRRQTNYFSGELLVIVKSHGFKSSQAPY